MKTTHARIIARLDIKGPNLVKGIHLEGLRVLGQPELFAEYYYQQGIDELIYMDVVASLYERNSLLYMISNIAKKIFIPLTVGGGIRTMDDIHNALRAGADKVCMNTAAIKNPTFIENAVKKFGSATIVIAIEAIKEKDGRYLAYTDNGREFTGVEVCQWAKQLNKMGVGEILLTSVDKEGTGTGFDIELVNAITTQVNIPVIAHGGAGSAQDVVRLFSNTTVSAAASSSLFHYDCAHHLNNSEVTAHAIEGNFDFLHHKKTFSKIQPCSISTLKKLLGQIK